MSNLRNTVFYNFLAGQIRLVANEELVNTLRCISVNLLQPLLYIRECVCRYEILARNIFRGRFQQTIIGYVVDNNDTMSPTVI